MSSNSITEAGDLQRRGFLKCMTWAGTAMIWTVAGGVPRSRLIGSAEAAANDSFTFAQISDSHLGFDKPANPNVTATLQDALNGVAAMPQKPAFMIHTGDITHLSKPAQFDTAAQLIGGTKLTLHTVPGEHDILEENGKSYLNRFGKGTKGDGWYSFNANGVHFVGLVNVVNLQGNGLGALGSEQLEWLEDDVKHLTASTPIVVFAHVPLWIVYADWGWGTSDGAQALILSEEVRLRDGAERPHPPDDAEGGGQCGVPHRTLHRVPAASARYREKPRADDGACRRTEAAPRNCQRPPCLIEGAAGHRRHAAGQLKYPPCTKRWSRAAAPGAGCCAMRSARVPWY